MSEIISGYLKRPYLLSVLQELIEARSKIPVESGDNKGYELGKSLGYVDALRDVVRLVKELPDEPKPKEGGRAWHQR